MPNLPLYSLPLLLLFFPFYTQAAALGGVPTLWCINWGIRCGGEAPITAIWGLMWSVIMIALSFIAITATGFLVYYGFLYIMSRGEEDNTRRAKAGIAYAIIGIIIAGLAAWIVNSIINII